MGFLDRFRKKPLDVVLTTGKQPENFYMAVLKYKDRPVYSVRYSHKKQPGELAKHIDDIPISDTLEVAKNIEDFIGSKWGGSSGDRLLYQLTNSPATCRSLKTGRF